MRYDSAPGASVGLSSDVLWTYEVTNTGDSPLGTIAISDAFLDGEGTAGTLTPTVSDISPLLPGETRTFEASAPAVAGQYYNAATVTAEAVTDQGIPLGIQAEPAVAESWYQGGSTGLAVVKTTNGEHPESAPGPSLNPGDDVLWAYTVTNTGELPLTNVEVVDQDADGNDVFRGQIATLAPGESRELSATGTAIAGQYSNTVEVTAADPLGGPDLTAADTSYYFGVQPGITFLKQVATTPTGPWSDTASVPSESSVYWRLSAINTGNVSLTNIEISDEHLGYSEVVAELAPGETYDTVIEEAHVRIGYENVAQLTVSPGSGDPIVAEGKAAVSVTTVVPATGGLSVTGAESGWMLVFAGLLFGLGILVRSARRRTTS